jgi:ribonucleotide reductase beta subunit family protein with ferritin-like domain
MYDPTDPIDNKNYMNLEVTQEQIAPSIPSILEDTDSLTVRYPEAVNFSNQQLKVFWLPDEVKVEKDLQDILVNMTAAEKHGVITTLKLFTLYELKAGSEYWGGRFKETFHRSEFQRMALTFAMFEVAVHKPFYSKINELLFLDNDEFYSSYGQDPILKARMDFIDQAINDPDELYSLGTFSMVEGAILYSSFAFLKHFQSQGKNKILNIVRGINFSVRDENIHAQAGAAVFRKLLVELNLAEDEVDRLKNRLRSAAEQIKEHEFHIVDLIFSEGNIDGITATQMKHFILSRLNLCLVDLGIGKLYEVKYNPIADWFYSGINSFIFNDTFSGVGNSYHRNWSETDFVWRATPELVLDESGE